MQMEQLQIYSGFNYEMMKAKLPFEGKKYLHLSKEII